MKCHMVSDEMYPVYSVVKQSAHHYSDRQVEVSPAKLRRWEQAAEEFHKVQDEMAAAFAAAPSGPESSLRYVVSKVSVKQKLPNTAP